MLISNINYVKLSDTASTNNLGQLYTSYGP